MMISIGIHFFEKGKETKVLSMSLRRILRPHIYSSNRVDPQSRHLATFT